MYDIDTYIICIYVYLAAANSEQKRGLCYERPVGE